MTEFIMKCVRAEIKEGGASVLVDLLSQPNEAAAGRHAHLTFSLCGEPTTYIKSVLEAFPVAAEFMIEIKPKPGMGAVAG